MKNYFVGSTIVLYGMMRCIFLVLVTTALLTGCESSSTTTSVGTKATGSQYHTAVTLSGLIRDQDGLVKNSKLEVTDFYGKEVAVFQLQGNASYAIEIPAETTYPLLVTAYPDSGKTKKEALSVAVLNSTRTKHDITPVSTVIAAKALSMGGYTHENLTGAAMSTIAVPGKKKTEAGFTGDPTQQYGGWH